MKRTELTAGESYSYKTSDYGISHDRIRVLDTEAVHRAARGGYSTRKTQNKDGIRVVFEEGSGDIWTQPSADRAELIKARLAAGESIKYGEQAILDLYDGLTEDGEVICRVLPRYIVQTWAEHEAQQERRAEAQVEAAKARSEKHDRQRALYEKLPERYKKYIDLTIHPDGSGGFKAYWNLEEFIELLIEENA